MHRRSCLRSSSSCRRECSSKTFWRRTVSSLRKTWTEEWIDEVESDHGLLRKTYGEEFRAVIDKHDVNTFFD
uniref:Uncharacterized protein n=1 Tax=Hyaloperonospora arabidopsidis (strain Emoy2) TaxID=559515 RepID=M4BUL4_HYAAE